MAEQTPELHHMPNGEDPGGKDLLYKPAVRHFVRSLRKWKRSTPEGHEVMVRIGKHKVPVSSLRLSRDEENNSFIINLDLPEEKRGEDHKRRNVTLAIGAGALVVAAAGLYYQKRKH